MPETPPRQVLAFVQDELDTATLYDALGTMERDAHLAEVYRKLAESERRHAEHWVAKLRAAGTNVPPHRLSWRTRILIWMAKHFGAKPVISIVANQEIADAQKYTSIDDRSATMVADEQKHARALRAIAGDGGAEGPIIARLEGRHRTTAGNALRAA